MRGLARYMQIFNMSRMSRMSRMGRITIGWSVHDQSFVGGLSILVDTNVLRMCPYCLLQPRLGWSVEKLNNNFKLALAAKTAVSLPRSLS